MKGTLLRVFSASIVVALVAAVVWTDLYANKLTTQESKKQSARMNEKTAVIEADQRKAADNEMKKLMNRLSKEEQLQNTTYLLAGIGTDQNLFTNKVDGYAIRIPRNMKVDMQFSQIRAVLESENLKIEIYRQDIDAKKGESIASYVNYSNQFLNNKIDHFKESQGRIRINDRPVTWQQWSRRALNRIDNDKRYYASVEVELSRDTVLTFLFKSSEKLDNKSYLDVIRSLELIEKTSEPYVRKIRKTNNKSWNKHTAQVYEQYFGEGARLQWGIFETDAPVDFTELKNIETKLDFTFPILLYYTGILENREMHPSLATALANAKKEGRLLELTLQTNAQTPGKGNMVYDVLDGEYDTYLKNYAREVVQSEAPVLFRLGNEMNGDWCVYSSHHTSKDTDVFKAFYRYIHQIFREAGADNVIWVWNPNGKAFPDFKWNDELCYYPGDEYVDVVGMTSYNTGTYYESETWTEFDQMYDALYQKYIDLYEKPLMITEFSSSSVGGSKEAWVSNMFRHILKYDRIKAAIWWDGCDWDADGNVARPYFIDETEELVRVFRENLARFK
jgi:hypothetical protein